MIQNFRYLNKFSYFEKESISFLDAISTIALKHYFHHSEDMRKCPKSDCDGIGFVEISAITSHIECENPF